METLSATIFIPLSRGFHDSAWRIHSAYWSRSRSGTILVGHFQYLSAYQDKVKEVGAQKFTAAEPTFANVSSTLSKAITLQQLLFDHPELL